MGNYRISAALLFLAFALYATSAMAELNEQKTEQAILYEFGSQRQNALYHWQLSEDEEGHLTSAFTTPDGVVVAEDRTALVDGVFLRYSYVRHNISERASAERRGDKIVFTQTWRGESRRRDEDYHPDFVAGPLIVPQIQAHWLTLSQGKEISIRYGVLDQLRSFVFKLNRVDPPAASAADTVVVQMRAASFFVRFFIDPIYFAFSNDGRTIYNITGRTLPVAIEGSDPRPIDAEMVFQRPSSGTR